METYIPGDHPFVQTEIPNEYRAALETLAPNITGIVEKTKVPGESWMDSIIRVLPAIFATEQQRRLLQVQVERARAGQPPLDVLQHTPGVSVGITPATQRMLLWGGVGLLGLVWMVTQRRGR